MFFDVHDFMTLCSAQHVIHYTALVMIEDIKHDFCDTNPKPYIAPHLYTMEFTTCITRYGSTKCTCVLSDNL